MILYGVEVDPERLKAFSAIPEPTDAAELQQFLAAANWVRGKVPEFATLAKPLQDLLNAVLAKAPRRTKKWQVGLR